MSMGDKDVEELHRIMRENDAKRLRQIAQAKAAAPSNKEPLDVERVKRECRVSVLGKMSDAELTQELEDMYYVAHPSYRTNQQLIDLITTLANYD